MAVPVFPSLRNISVPVLRKIPDQMLQIIIFFFANPGRTSSLNENEMVSFRDINSQYGKDPGRMCNECASSIERACNHYFPGVRVECSWAQKYKFDEDNILQGTYTMDISVLDKSGVPIIDRQQVVITKDGDEIDCRFLHKGDEIDEFA